MQSEFYQLEIYEPGGRDDVACTMKSSQPFGAIHVGDLINPRVWNQHYAGGIQERNPRRYGIVLRVTTVEHMIGQRGDGTVNGHKVCVFTEAVDDVRENRAVTS